MFDSIVNDDVRYPRFLSSEAISIMRKVSGARNLSQVVHVVCVRLVVEKKSREKVGR